VRVDADRIFINDGGVWTSAGASAGIDLCLGLVEADLGADHARNAARRLVLHHRRAGGQSQHSTLLELEATGDRIAAVLEHARRNLRAPLTIEELAGVARLSPRQFSRVFQQETGQSPAKAVEGLRLQAARMMLENTNRPIEAIAVDAGFGDPERMRRAFLRAFSQPPQAIRRSAQAAA
jgi:transcriptional regulator GlxA family with amidase domain